MLACFSQITPDWLKRAYVYTGSVGPFKQDFRYRLEMDEKERLIHAAVYTGVCYELAETPVCQDFAWDDAGAEQLRLWLQEQYERFSAGEKAGRG